MLWGIISLIQKISPISNKQKMRHTELHQSKFNRFRLFCAPPTLPLKPDNNGGFMTSHMRKRRKIPHSAVSSPTYPIKLKCSPSNLKNIHTVRANVPINIIRYASNNHSKLQTTRNPILKSSSMKIIKKFPPKPSLMPNNQTNIFPASTQRTYEQQFESNNRPLFMNSLLADLQINTRDNLASERGRRPFINKHRNFTIMNAESIMSRLNLIKGDIKNATDKIESIPVQTKKKESEDVFNISNIRQRDLEDSIEVTPELEELCRKFG